MRTATVARAWFGLTGVVVGVGIVVQLFATADVQNGRFAGLHSRLFNVFCIFTAERAWLPFMDPTVFAAPPDRIHREGDVTVMQQSTVDDLAHIQQVWPLFEHLVGLRGRKMFALIDTAAHSYTVCTPVKDDDDPDRLGLQVGTLPGGWYLRGRIVGEPPQVYEHIADGMAELEAMMPADPTRPLVEFYRRRDEIDLWLPIQA
jgi:hypothetical protein